MSRPTANAIVESILDALDDEREGITVNNDIVIPNHLHKVIREERNEEFTSNSIISQI